MSTSTTTTATDYDKLQDARLKKIEEKLFDTLPPIPPTCGPDPDPNSEHVKDGGWGGDTAGAKTWESVQMKDDPTQWKVVDKNGVNIAHKFASEADADKYITYHACIAEGGDPDPVPGPPSPGPEPGPEPSPSGDTPYPIKGTPMQSTQRGPTTRHYASGKPDDETIEKNVKNIAFENYQWVCFGTMTKIEHPDTISLKFGGQHMGAKGWYDCGVSFGDGQGQTCLGTEPAHPSTKLCIVKGPKIGEVLNKKIGVAGIFHKKMNHIEFWTQLPGEGWTKQCEGTSVGGLKPDPKANETQLRIDGFDKGSIPTIHSAIVTEI